MNSQSETNREIRDIEVTALTGAIDTLEMLTARAPHKRGLRADLDFCLDSLVRVVTNRQESIEEYVERGKQLYLLLHNYNYEGWLELANAEGHLVSDLVFLPEL